MRKISFIFISSRTFAIVLAIIFINVSFLSAQNVHESKLEVSRLMDSLWLNPNSFINHDAPNWIRLNEHLENVDFLQINEIIHSIFFGKNSFMLNKSHAYDGFIGTLNKSANEKKIKKYHQKIKKGFRDNQKYPDHKVVLVEGDSWFEYPIFLKDITDFLVKKPNLAVYSHAHGSDWISNMISSLQFEYDYIKVKPDVFIISGGGNDFLADYRLSNFLLLSPVSKDDTSIKVFKEYVKQRILSKDENQVEYALDTALISQITNGRRYLNMNAYRFLASLKIEYKMLFESLRKADTSRFSHIKIITQGYDFAIPTFKRKYGSAMLFTNGDWLKEPLMMNGIIDEQTQQDIIKTIMFEINEMLIELGKEYDNVYHVDIRGFTHFFENYKHKKKGYFWHDEFHPKSVVFKQISNVYYSIIENKIPQDKRVINAIDSFEKMQNIQK